MYIYGLRHETRKSPMGGREEGDRRRGKEGAVSTCGMERATKEETNTCDDQGEEPERRLHRKV